MTDGKLIKKIKKAQRKRKKTGVFFKDIGLVDFVTAVEFLNLRRGIEMTAANELVSQIAELRGDLEDAEIIIKHQERIIDEKDDHIDHLNKEFAEEISAAQNDHDEKLEGIVDHLTLNESIFLQKLKRALNSVTKKSNKTPLLAALQAANEIIEEKMEEINGRLPKDEQGEDNAGSSEV